MPRFSVIVPVYNRIDEVADLIESLSRQTYTDFEAIIVEDGSSEPCKDVVESYKGKIDAHYHYKPNEGRSIARNYGMERSKGDFLIFFQIISRRCRKSLTNARWTVSEGLMPPTTLSPPRRKPSTTP